MRVICISHDGSRRTSFWLNPVTHLILPAVVIAVIIGALSVGQFITSSEYDALVENTEASQALSKAEISQVFGMLHKQQSTVQELEDKYDVYTVDIKTLTQTLARLQAETTRLDAFGARLVRDAGLDPEEFNFINKQPSVGGLAGFDELDNEKPTIAKKLTEEANALGKKLLEQREQLESIAQLIKGRQLERKMLPSSMPVKGGHISSSYGYRRDPFHGRKKLHKGIDFSGRQGTNIYSVAGGIVSNVGRKGGYGNVVEIEHKDGLVTRYAHLKNATVEIGEVVKKGQLIAHMGSTGRSTGSHLHLEVLENGQQINPMNYLSTQKK